MVHKIMYNVPFLLCFCWFIIHSSLSQGHGSLYAESYLIDNKVLNVGEELWEETLPLKMGSRLYELRGLKSSTWYEVKISYPASIPSSFSIQLKRGKSDVTLNLKRKLLNTEKLIFKADHDDLIKHQGGMYVLVSVEPVGVVAIPHASEREFVMFNIVCDELLLGIPHKAWWVVAFVILCLVLAFVAPCYLPSHLLQKNPSLSSTDRTISKDY
ncbi:hypothetical protein AQUCO_03500271v1 [Aquilegia coerulea]|uniref:Uncharacterized protein n=1 Tax=Aquilegia coerulea TaxID=218851 RepID=A0A2G5CX00_AQUCA|nr:hypothetical protein AQUCO_03500271v1 [Aquilegia coerulea]PIA35791.1 hypothetical protein AQUCO_03500271v1 [Aquilegia coerulea]PIA35792.1 hypothetical protein AQUCO_03500271v1 [Aquilegia coerulea]